MSIFHELGDSGLEPRSRLDDHHRWRVVEENLNLVRVPSPCTTSILSSAIETKLPFTTAHRTVRSPKRQGTSRSDEWAPIGEQPIQLVRAEVVVALDGIGGAAPSLEAALSDEHYAVRRNAAIALFKRRGDAMVKVLIEQAADPSDRVREWAAQLLGEVNDERARKELDRLARKDDHDIVRTTARRALDGETSVSGLDEGESAGDDPLNETPDL